MFAPLSSIAAPNKPNAPLNKLYKPKTKHTYRLFLVLSSRAESKEPHEPLNI